MVTSAIQIYPFFVKHEGIAVDGTLLGLHYVKLLMPWKSMHMVWLQIPSMVTSRWVSQTFCKCCECFNEAIK